MIMIMIPNENPGRIIVQNGIYDRPNRGLE